VPGPGIGTHPPGRDRTRHPTIPRERVAILRDLVAAGFGTWSRRPIVPREMVAILREMVAAGAESSLGRWSRTAADSGLGRAGFGIWSRLYKGIKKNLAK